MTLQQRTLRRNLLVLGGDMTMFFVGFVFWDPTVVVPAFVKDLTGSEFMVGLLSAIRLTMITLPSLLAASVLSVQRRNKPLLVWASIGGRVPVLLLAGVTFLLAGRTPWMVVGALAATVALFYASEGMNSISWPAVIGKVIPAGMRGRLMGTGQLLSSVAGLGSGALVRLILGRADLPSSTRWAMIFCCAFVGFLLSWIAITLIHEEPGEVTATRVDMRSILRTMWGQLRADVRLRRVVAVQLLLGIAAAVYPFFVVRAQDLVADSDAQLGIYLILQNLGGGLAALICGQLVDHVGSWSAIRLQAVVPGLALLAVILARVLGLAQPFYLLAFFLLGFTTSSWWSFTAYLLDLAPPAQQPTYLAASGILNSPTVISSLLVGGLFAVVGAENLFAIALALSLVGMVLAFRLAKVGGKT